MSVRFARKTFAHTLTPTHPHKGTRTSAHTHTQATNKTKEKMAVFCRVVFRLPELKKRVERNSGENFFLKKRKMFCILMAKMCKKSKHAIQESKSRPKTPRTICSEVILASITRKTANECIQIAN